MFFLQPLRHLGNIFARTNVLLVVFSHSSKIWSRHNTQLASLANHEIRKIKNQKSHRVRHVCGQMLPLFSSSVCAKLAPKTKTYEPAHSSNHRSHGLEIETPPNHLFLPKIKNRKSKIKNPPDQNGVKRTKTDLKLSLYERSSSFNRKSERFAATRFLPIRNQNSQFKN